MSKWENNAEIQILQEYLRIPSVHPNVDYSPCVEFLKTQAMSLGLPISVHYTHPEKPFVIITWIGTEPHLPSIILNSHMDVVPVFEEFWTHPPFGAEIDQDGKIFARGSQDTKALGMLYLGSIRKLLKEGVTLRRTIHVMFVPDEEICCEYGMKMIVQTPEFKALNVGMVFDEGGVNPSNEYYIYYAERSEWRMFFKCSGTTGHGSILHENTAGEKVRFIIDKFMDYRHNEVNKLSDKTNVFESAGDVTAINLTMLSGGVQINVVPPVLTVGFDCRLGIHVDHTIFEEMLNQWCMEAGGNIEIEYDSKKPKVAPTKLDDSNPFWVAFSSAMVDDLNLKISPIVCPARTDCCFIRELGIPAIGFAPINYTPLLVHCHDEYIPADKYLEGIEIYEKILLRIGNI